ncbi:hypothetical protein M3Y98_00787100 [Aphelenchoides besseyi]|nr:hypothetical protein M3Y98_00787100 [Aphelenchoides besseyi]
MSYSTLVLVSLLVPAVVADWSTFGFGFGGQQSGCRDISPMCTRLEKTGICKSPAAHICGVTCGQCGKENDNNENQENGIKPSDDNQEPEDGNEVQESGPSSDDNNNQFGNGGFENNNNDDFNNGSNDENNVRADGDEGFFNIHE